MTREEIVNRQLEITKENCSLDLTNNSTRSKVWKRFKELCKENLDLQRELDKLDGKTYNSTKWITKYIGSSYESLKAARFDLINKIKDLPGVEVEENKTGVIGVTIYTEYKVYHYIIHAHYRVEEIPGTRRVEKTALGEFERYDTRQIFVAYLDATRDNWSWRYSL
jgi:hypothetical protein